jgi:hypothetical protein
LHERPQILRVKARAYKLGWSGHAQPFRREHALSSHCAKLREPSATVCCACEPRRQDLAAALAPLCSAPATVLVFLALARARQQGGGGLEWVALSGLQSSVAQHEARLGIVDDRRSRLAQGA